MLVDHGAPGSPAHALDYHSTRNLLANFGSRPSLETPSVPSVAFRRCVNSRRITYFGPWVSGDKVLPWAHQKVRKQNKGEGNIYLRRGTPRQASVQRRHCAVSFFWSFVLLSLEGVFLIWRIFIFIIYQYKSQTNLHFAPSFLISVPQTLHNRTLRSP